MGATPNAEIGVARISYGTLMYWQAMGRFGGALAELAPGGDQERSAFAAWRCGAIRTTSQARPSFSSAYSEAA